MEQEKYPTAASLWRARMEAESSHDAPAAPGSPAGAYSCRKPSLPNKFSLTAFAQSLLLRETNELLGNLLN